jgi:hypothetical protein
MARHLPALCAAAGQARRTRTAQPRAAAQGSGINVRGKESQRAFGRRSKAEDILAYTILQAEEAIVRAEMNEVGQRFLDLPEGPRRIRISGRSIRSARSATRTRRPARSLSAESRIAAEDAPYTVSVKVDGEEHRITLNRDNPPRFASPMRCATSPASSSVPSSAFLGKFTRFFSAINTRYAPPFIITNAIRDLR